MALEHAERPDQQVEKAASDEELLLVAEYLDDSGYEDLSALLEGLAELEDTDVDHHVYQEISREFSRQIALMPENAEALKTALDMINVELSENSPSYFHDREDYLEDLYQSPGKYFKRQGKKLIVSQPGNTVKFTRIHDFIGPYSDIIPMGDPDNYELTHNGTIYNWSPENETWEDTKGDRLKLKRPQESVQIDQKVQALKKEDVYNAVWQGVQPQVDTQGVTRGGYVQIRNHLFMDHREHEEAEPGTRPDPVPRAYYFYGRYFKIKPEALNYTGQSPERHDNLAKIFRSGFVKAAPTAGGGVPTMEESGLNVLRDYKFIDKNMRGETLDRSYEEALGMANEYLDKYGNHNLENIGAALSLKGVFDARVESFLLRYDAMVNTDTGLSPSMEGELYDVHVNKILEEVRPYMKALNKLPKVYRDKYVENDVIKKMNRINELVPDEYIASKKALTVYTDQFSRSLSKTPLTDRVNS